MANIVRFDPFRDMDRLMQSMWSNDWPRGLATTFATPLVDMYEEDGRLVVETHVGGLGEKDVDVQVDRGALVIKGERNEAEENKKKRNYMHRESSTTIYRRIMLPKDADTDKISANLSDGVLRIEIPIHAKPAPKKISIKKK